MFSKRANVALAAGLFSIAPLLLASKGCDAVVGVERTSCGAANAPCPAGEFCDFEPDAACGANNHAGVCRSIPSECAGTAVPVCGCDDRTYDDACSAHLAGVSVASEGECSRGVGAACGGLSGAECPADLFCSYAPDALCGLADAEGTCEPRPDGCDDVALLVCGCNEQTYPNPCQANYAGVSVAHEGPCP